MKLLLIALAISLPLWGLLALPLIRAIARIATDRMLYGKKTPTLKCIKRCVRVLTWSNKWISIDETPDQLRIIRLRDILEEMQNPHG